MIGFKPLLHFYKILKTSLVTMTDLRAYNTSLQNISDRMLFQITKYVQHPDIFCILKMYFWKCKQLIQIKVFGGGMRANTETALSWSLRWSFSKSLYILSFFSGSLLIINHKSYLLTHVWRGFVATELRRFCDYIPYIALWFTEPSCNKIISKYFMKNIIFKTSSSQQTYF